MRRPTEDRKNIAMFQPDLSETTTVARVSEVVKGGFRPLVLGFRRGRYNRGYVPSWPEVDLGKTQDARYGNRLKALARAIPAIIRTRRELGACDVLFARNLDQLLLAFIARVFFNAKPILVYEVVDIQPSFTAANLLGVAIRTIERILLGRIDLLIVSSPAFWRCYFAAIQGYRGEWILVENKLNPSGSLLAQALERRSKLATSVRSRGRWVIGYFGLIRGQATVELMLRLAKSLPDKVELRFRGVVTTVDERWFRAEIAGRENVSYEGEYRNPDDLAELYAGVDFVWALDLEEVAHNSRWLLPCRFYEAGLFGVPCLAVRDFEIGRRIEQLDVGWAFDNPLLESLIRFFEEIDATSYRDKQRNLLACPVDTFVAENEGDHLCRKLDQLLQRQSQVLKPRAESARRHAGR